MSNSIVIKAGQEYKRSDYKNEKGYDVDVVEVLSITIKNGRTLLHVLHVYEEMGNDFYTDAEDTKNWTLA